MDSLYHHSFYSRIADLIKKAQRTIVQTVNNTMVRAYFEIGRMIVEEEQKGDERASYGESVINSLSENLTNEFGRGFSVTNVQQMSIFLQVNTIQYYRAERS